MDSLWTLKNITSLDGFCYKAIDPSISKKIFSYLKMIEKNTAVEDNKHKRVKRMTQNKNNSIKSILQHGRFVDNNISNNVSYFRISRFDPVSQIVNMEGSYHLLSYKD